MSQLRDFCHQQTERWEKKFSKEEMDRISNELDLYEFYHVDDHMIYMINKACDCGAGNKNKTNSLLAYALGITSKKPDGEFGLVVKREQPDFDIDFDKYGRDRVKDAVRSKYGNKYFASIGTYAEYKPKSAFRDIVRCICGSSEEASVGLISKMYLPATNVDMSTGDWIGTDEIFIHEELRQYVAKIVEVSKQTLGENCLEDIDEFIAIFNSLRQNYRQTGLHAAGIIISNEPLQSIVPMYVDASGNNVVQLDMKSAGLAGLCKIDFLGLGTLSVIQNTLNMAHSMGYIENSMTIDDIPMNDPKVFEFMQKGLYAGLFQMKSVGIRKTMQKCMPTSIEDISDVIALHRPGPMSAGFEEKYLSLRHGRTKPEYLHDDLKPILEKTSSLIIYQESIIEIAQKIAGFSPNEGDNLRRIVGKKLSSKLAQAKPKFIDGCVRHSGWTLEEATKLWEQIEGFGNYGFNKCLSEDTLVLTPSGLVRIDQLNFGDTIYSYVGNGGIITNTVRAVTFAFDEPIVKVGNENVEIECTRDHYFLNEDGYKMPNECNCLVVIDNKGLLIDG